VCYYLVIKMTPEEFKEWKARMRLSQVELARRLDVTETTIYRWERGLAPISRMLVLALKQVEAEIKEEMSR
jgi:DNA-binding transcriptional regulator YiaG